MKLLQRYESRTATSAVLLFRPKDFLIRLASRNWGQSPTAVNALLTSSTSPTRSIRAIATSDLGPRLCCIDGSKTCRRFTGSPDFSRLAVVEPFPGTHLMQNEQRQVLIAKPQRSAAVSPSSVADERRLTRMARLHPCEHSVRLFQATPLSIQPTAPCPICHSGNSPS